MVKYKITVKTTSGIILSFTTSNYEIINETQIRFLDERKNIYKIFDSRNCEIEEVEKND